MNYESISALTGGRLTPEDALAILNERFPGPRCDQFAFLGESSEVWSGAVAGPNSLNRGRPLIFKFRQCEPEFNYVQTIERPFKTPYTNAFNAGIEQALGTDFSVDAQVHIRRSRNLLAQRIINLREVPIASSCRGNTVDGEPCNRQLQYIGFLDSNVFTLALRKRHRQRYSFLASYTFTDATDNFTTLEVPTGIGSFLFNNHPELDIGRSLNTPEHVFVLSGVYEIPYGLNLSGVLRGASGRPFNAGGLPVDSDGDQNFDNRLIGTEKGEFETDPFFNVDLRLAKQFGLGEGMSLTALIEVFNLTNRANPLEVNQVMGPDIGETVRPFPGREIQLGFRLDF